MGLIVNIRAKYVSLFLELQVPYLQHSLENMGLSNINLPIIRVEVIIHNRRSVK